MKFIVKTSFLYIGNNDIYSVCRCFLYIYFIIIIIFILGGGWEAGTVCSLGDKRDDVQISS